MSLLSSALNRIAEVLPGTSWFGFIPRLSSPMSGTRYRVRHRVSVPVVLLPLTPPVRRFEISLPPTTQIRIANGIDDGLSAGSFAAKLAVAVRRRVARHTKLYAYQPKARLVMPKTNGLTAKQSDDLLSTLKGRFEANAQRHGSLDWTTVRARLESNGSKLWSLSEMEKSGGEPDVVDVDRTTGELIFVDCSAQSPKGRRSLCYDREALDARKEHKPKDSAVDMATAMGATLLSEAEYRRLQELGQFDTTTSSWVHTPAKIRKLGGALFCDRRYDTVFLYHNGAESYYAARGFRCTLKV